MRRLGPFLLMVGLLTIAGSWWIAERIARSYETVTYEAGFARATSGAAVTRQFGLRVLAFTSTVHELGRRWAHLDASGDSAAAEVAHSMHVIARDPSNPVDFIGIISASGHLRWWSGEARLDTTAEGRDYFDELKADGADTFVGAPIIGRQSGMLVIPFSARLRDDAGDFGGVVVALVRVAYVSESLADLMAKPGDFAALLRHDGLVLARSSRTEELVGRSILSAQQASEMHASTGSVRVTSAITGRDQLIAWQRVAEANLIAVMGVGGAPLTADIARHRALLRGIAAGVTGLLLICAIAMILNRRLAEQTLAGRAQTAALDTLHKLHAGMPAIFFLQDVAPGGSVQTRYIGGELGAVTGWPEHVVRRGEIALFAETPEKERLAVSAVLRDGESKADWQLRQPNDGWRWMRSTVRLLERRADGSATIVGYTIDISTEREAQLRAMSSARLSSLGEMASGLAHELKQPLTAISLAAENAEFSLASGDAAGTAPRLERIRRQAHRAAHIIDNLRRFAGGRLTPAPIQSVPLSQAVENSITLLSGTLNDASIVLDVQLAAGDGEPTVLADLIGLEQMLVNLLLNARDALAALPPGAERQISIRAASRTDGKLQLQVEDTGDGISPEVLTRLFEPFVTTKGPDQGTGLGLAISFGIVKAMGGTLEGHNTSKGAVFTISLPSAPAKCQVPRNATVTT